jgi:hypothetical protein
MLVSFLEKCIPQGFFNPELSCKLVHIDVSQIIASLGSLGKNRDSVQATNIYKRYKENHAGKAQRPFPFKGSLLLRLATSDMCET